MFIDYRSGWSHFTIPEQTRRRHHKSKIKLFILKGLFSPVSTNQVIFPQRYVPESDLLG